MALALVVVMATGRCGCRIIGRGRFGIELGVGRLFLADVKLEMGFEKGGGVDCSGKEFWDTYYMYIHGHRWPLD